MHILLLKGTRKIYSKMKKDGELITFYSYPCFSCGERHPIEDATHFYEKGLTISLEERIIYGYE